MAFTIVGMTLFAASQQYTACFWSIFDIKLSLAMSNSIYLQLPNITNSNIYLSWI